MEWNGKLDEQYIIIKKFVKYNILDYSLKSLGYIVYIYIWRKK